MLLGRFLVFLVDEVTKTKANPRNPWWPHQENQTGIHNCAVWAKGGLPVSWLIYHYRDKTVPSGRHHWGGRGRKQWELTSNPRPMRWSWGLSSLTFYKTWTPTHHHHQLHLPHPHANHLSYNPLTTQYHRIFLTHLHFHQAHPHTYHFLQHLVGSTPAPCCVEEVEIVRGLMERVVMVVKGLLWREEELVTIGVVRRERGNVATTSRRPLLSSLLCGCLSLCHLWWRPTKCWYNSPVI